MEVPSTLAKDVHKFVNIVEKRRENEGEEVWEE